MDTKKILYTQKIFTVEELKTLNRPDNAHVAYRGKVYDISGFVSKHPGGFDQIMLGAGHDITYLFDSYHKQEIIKILEKYHVGELVGHDMPTYNNNRSLFYSTVKQRVEDYFESNNIDPKIDYQMFFIEFIFIVCWLLSLLCMIKFHNSIIAVFCAITWGIFTGLITFSLGHDSGHFAITHNPWVWRSLNIVVEVVSGLSTYCWCYQHTFAHHSYTNINGADPDIVTTDDRPDIWRIKKSQPWNPWYIYQHIYMPILYSLLSAKMRLQDFHTVYILKKGTIRMNPLSLYQWTVFLCGKMFHLMIRFYVLYSYMPFTYVIIYNVIFEITLGWWLAIITQINHVNEEVSWLENDVTTCDWAELQVRTTKDYNCSSFMCTLLTGALNHQVTHHLFPGIMQSHYQKITPIIQDTCKQFDIPYHLENNFFAAFIAHLKFLFRMGHLKNV